MLPCLKVAPEHRQGHKQLHIAEQQQYGLLMSVADNSARQGKHHLTGTGQNLGLWHNQPHIKDTTCFTAGHCCF